jgi:hypothetical protein
MQLQHLAFENALRTNFVFLFNSYVLIPRSVALCRDVL